MPTGQIAAHMGFPAVERRSFDLADVAPGAALLGVLRANVSAGFHRGAV